MSKYDVCIVGSGAGGAPLAHRLVKQGLKVIMIERGKNLFPQKKDELDQIIKPAYTPDLDSGIRELVYNNNTPFLQNSLWGASTLGGGTRVMSGIFFKMKEEDFKPVSNFGKIKESTAQDWPIGLSDLDPYYHILEKEIGISGSEGGHGLPPLKAHPFSKTIDDTCKRLGYTVSVTPRAILSEHRPEQGRNSCSYSGLCGSYPCLTGAKGSTFDVYLKSIMSESNFTLLTETVVTAVRAFGDNAQAIDAITKENKKIRIRANTFVLACGAIETARLLLNSSENHPGGLCNSSGEVGSNLSFYIPSEVTGFFDKKSTVSSVQSDSAFIQRTIQDWHYLSDESLEYKRGGTVSFLFPHANPIRRMSLLSYSDMGKRIIGKKLQEKAEQYLNWNHVQSDVFIEYIPNKNTTVTLSQSIGDKWGVPVAKVSYSPTSECYKRSQVMGQNITKLFLEMGAEKAEYKNSIFTAGELQYGTCRFGEDPKTSVLNRSCRSHDIKNLYVADGSFMPSGIPVPGSFTIMANSLRLADILSKS